jgi:hypothetical protein
MAVSALLVVLLRCRSSEIEHLEISERAAGRQAHMKQFVEARAYTSGENMERMVRNAR